MSLLVKKAASALRRLSRSPRRNAAPALAELHVLTLNVLLQFDEARYARIVNLVQRENYDCVAFQEATEQVRH